MRCTGGRWQPLLCVVAVAVASTGGRAKAAKKARDALPRVFLKELDSGNRIFTDAETGREHVFHGTNVVVKGPPWLPSRGKFDPLTSLVAEDYTYLKAAGINLLRLSVTWAGAEPQRGEYNDTYFQELREIVQEAGDYGLYVLLDMHQDLLSEKFCGQGLPSWAIVDPTESYLRFPVPAQAVPAKVDQDGFPTRAKCEDIFGDNFFNRDKWDVGHAAYATQLAYEALYTNVQNITDAWGAFLAKVASTVQGLSNVIGIELLNEPFAGNAIKNPYLMMPGVADKQRLQGAYDKVAGIIRKVDTEVILFFEGVTWDNQHPVGFEHAPGGDDWANKSVLAYHYYEPPQDENVQSYMEVRMSDARRLGTGLFMTESCCNMLFETAFPVLNAAGQSWAQWEWKDWCREDAITLNSSSQNAAFGACKTGFGAGPFSVTEGAVEPDKDVMKILAQPYAPLIGGHLNGTTWNAKTGVFELQFVLDPTLASGTVVFVNKDLTFPHGYSIVVEPSDALDIEEQPELKQVTFTPSSGSQPWQVLIRIKRKSKSWRSRWPFWKQGTESKNAASLSAHGNDRFLAPVFSS